MSSHFVSNPSNLAKHLYEFCLQPGVGLYPTGLKSGTLLFGPRPEVLSPRNPLVAADGSPRSVFFAQEPNTMRGIIDGASLVSRNRSERGLFREIHRLEGLLNNNPRDIFEAAGPRQLSLEQYRPGFSERIEAYSAICVRDIIRGKRPAPVSGADDASELAADIEFAAALTEGTALDPAEIMFMAGTIFASIGGLYKERAVAAFSKSCEFFLSMGRDSAALVVADLAVDRAGGFQPMVGGMSLGAMVARAAKMTAQDFANTEPIDAMIARSRGITAALATGSWDDAGTLFRLEADASSGLDRAHGLVRSAWAFTRWEMAENANDRWPQINWLLNTAGSMMEDVPEMEGAAKELLELGNTANSWMRD